MAKRTVTLDVEALTLRCDSRQITLRHHKAGLFLGALIGAATQERALSAQEFVALWQQSGSGSAPPDRTAMRRVLAAVQDGLELVMPEGGARVQTAPRRLTVGPWQLVCEPDEDWQVINADSLGHNGASPPRLTPEIDPHAWCTVALGLAVADDLNRQGLYADGAQVLAQQLQTLPLSDEAHGLWALRLVRCLRRTGEQATAGEWVRSARPCITRVKGRAGASLRGHWAMLDAWLAFDAAPNQTSRELDFGRLLSQIDAAPSAKLYWDWANLQGLALRRRIGQRLAQHTRDASVAQLVNEGHATFGAAYFWVSLAQDAYHQQAVASNYAYFLHWLFKARLLPSADAAVAWFRLAHTLVERFDLPQDSAWDFIMTAELYFENGALRQQIEADSLAWPAQKNPAERAFYLQSLELARRHGDARQQIWALNQYAKFLALQGEASEFQNIKRQRDLQMAAAPAMLAQMVLDGFVPI